MTKRPDGRAPLSGMIYQFSVACKSILDRGRTEGDPLDTDSIVVYVYPGTREEHGTEGNEPHVFLSGEWTAEDRGRFDVSHFRPKSFLYSSDGLLQAGGRVSRARLVRPAPGARLLELADFFCSRRTFQEILQPAVADLRDEYNGALSEGRLWKARWVRVRGTWAALSAVGLHAAVQFALRIWKLAK